MAKRNPDIKTLTVALTEDELKRIKKRAKDFGITTNELIRRCTLPQMIDPATGVFSPGEAKYWLGSIMLEKAHKHGRLPKQFKGTKKQVERIDTESLRELPE